MSKPSPAAVVADLRRVSALFQARAIAAQLGARPPAPEAFKA